MPHKLLACISLPPATIESVPIYDFAIANEGLALLKMDTEGYYPCCRKIICRGCIQSFSKSGNNDQCPYCKADRSEKTEEEMIEEIMKRAEANDPISICLLANSYQFGRPGISQDEEKAMELYVRAANLGSNEAHFQLGLYYNERGELKKVKLHWEATAMAGHEVARHNVGTIESNSGNME
jgi:TPR repeat protein